MCASYSVMCRHARRVFVSFNSSVTKRRFAYLIFVQWNRREALETLRWSQTRAFDGNQEHLLAPSCSVSLVRCMGGNGRANKVRRTKNRGSRWLFGKCGMVPLKEPDSRGLGRIMGELAMSRNEPCVCRLEHCLSSNQSSSLFVPVYLLLYVSVYFGFRGKELSRNNLGIRNGNDSPPISWPSEIHSVAKYCSACPYRTLTSIGKVSCPWFDCVGV